MKSFAKFLEEYKDTLNFLETLEISESSHDSETCEDEYDSYEVLDEAAKETASKVSSNTKGVLHELLVGYHLNNKKHMEKHDSKEGDSPREVHDKLKSTLHPDDYKKINDRAESAANHLKKHIETNGHKVSGVQWTSKKGDLEKATGIPASQKQDSSDIVVSTHKKQDGSKKVTHHGVSLKVTDATSKHVPTSNPGLDNAGPNARSHLDNHRKEIVHRYPELKKASNASERKGMLKANPEMAKHVKAKSGEVLHKIAKDLHHHLSTAPKSELVDHVRHLLHSEKTPMEKEGHTHIRHITYRSGSAHAHDTVRPGTHHEHIYNDPSNITVHHSGTSVVFKHKGKTFARHRLKFESQSDPLGSIKGSGETAGD